MKEKAFTLAEVLIVLGIIGIVAAMTIPQLISNYQKAATVSQLKKTYSMLNQALKASIADNGDVSDWDYVPVDKNYHSWPNPTPSGEKYILPYLKVISTIKGIKDYDVLNSSGTDTNTLMCYHYGYYLVDGSLITFTNYFPGNGYDWSMNYSLY